MLFISVFITVGLSWDSAKQDGRLEEEEEEEGRQTNKTNKSHILLQCEAMDEEISGKRQRRLMAAPQQRKTSVALRVLH